MDANHPEQRLMQTGFTLPDAPAPLADYLPYRIAGSLLFVSGQGPVRDGKLAFLGKLGESVSMDDGETAAQLAALAVLAQAKAACNGDLGRVAGCARLGGFVNCCPDFTQHPTIINAASAMMVTAFGEAGRHARFAVGAPSLPLDMAVEVEAIFELHT